MALIQPTNHSGFTMIEGYAGETKQSGSDNGTPWETYIIQTVPVSASDYALHVKTIAPTGSITSSAGMVIYVSGADGLPHPVGGGLSGDGQYLIRATPDYSRATHSIDLVNTDVGTTSSDYSIYQYKYFCMQFSNMLNCTASLSGTLDSVAADPTYWIPITADVSGFHTITGSCIFCQDTPVKWEKIRVNFSKSINTNSIDFWMSLYN